MLKLSSRTTDLIPLHTKGLCYTLSKSEHVRRITIYRLYAWRDYRMPRQCGIVC